MQDEQIPVQDPSTEQDPPKKLSIGEFAAKIKEKYPDYKDIEDNALVDKIVSKYPVLFYCKKG